MILTGPRLINIFVGLLDTFRIDGRWMQMMDSDGAMADADGGIEAIDAVVGSRGGRAGSRGGRVRGRRGGGSGIIMLHSHMY